LPSLIITIATGGMASALAAAIGFGSSFPVTEPSFLQVLFDVKIGMFSLVVVIAVCLAAFMWYVENKLTLGHYIFGMATNPRALLEAGINTAGIIIFLCLFSALLNGFAGILLVVEFSSGQPSIAQSLFLDGLTAVLLGGTMIQLGKPNVIGTIVGVLIIAVLVRGGALLGWNDAVFQAIKGALLLLAVSVVIWSNRQS
ncbi:MAG: ABC transporter permease, partial [Pseudomonadota bacterium]